MSGNQLFWRAGATGMAGFLLLIFGALWLLLQPGPPNLWLSLAVIGASSALLAYSSRDWRELLTD